MLDEDGNTIFVRNGTAKTVSYKLEDIPKMRGAVGIHNHPETPESAGLPTFIGSDDLMSAMVHDQLSENVRNSTMMASFQPEPTSALRQSPDVRAEFVSPLAATEKSMNRRLTTNKNQYRDGKISYEHAIQNAREIIEKSTNEARDYLRDNQQKYGYIYEERMLHK
jgi:hypothetical protein